MFCRTLLYRSSPGEEVPVTNTSLPSMSIVPSKIRSPAVILSAAPADLMARRPARDRLEGRAVDAPALGVRAAAREAVDHPYRGVGGGAAAASL